MKFMSIRLITFDVTGTLLTTNLEKHYVEIGSQYGLKIEPKKLARTFKNSYQQLAIEHPNFGKHSGLGWKNWWTQLVHNVFRDQHNNIPTLQLDQVANSLIRRYSSSECWNLCPGAVDLLEYLHSRNVTLGVISNFDTRLESILNDTKIRSYFSFILTSYDFGEEKPCTSIFAEAMRLSNRNEASPIKPYEAFHIGNNIKADYLGAKNAGWNAALITHDKECIEDPTVNKEDCFKHLKELKGYFQPLIDKNIKYENK